MNGKMPYKPIKPGRTVSIVVPIYNELDNIELCCNEICDVMDASGRQYEVIFVDDGSTDGSREVLQKLSSLASVDDNHSVRVVLFRRNYGQTAAMHAGIQHATGDYVVTIDGDLQNDPRDIPMMLEKLDDGFDLVHGWRRNRQDKLVSRKIPSKIANWLISRVTGFPIHDLGCTLKAMKREIAQQLELYGEMHRFIPVLAHQLGAKACEVVTRHRARQFGTTKYGIGRTSRVILDLITVHYVLKYFSSPMKLFGKFGLWSGAIGLFSSLTTVGMKLFGGVDMTGNPLLMLGVLATILSVQFFSLGLIGEVCARIYFSQQDKASYQVRELVNFETGLSAPQRFPKAA